MTRLLNCHFSKVANCDWLLSVWLTLSILQDWHHTFKLSLSSLVSSDTSADFGCRNNMWILKLSGFSPFLIRLVFVCHPFPTPALNQPTQSDCLDFVLCILFSYTHLFLLLQKRGIPPKSTFSFVKLQKSTFCFFIFLSLVCLFIRAFSACCGCVQIRSCLKRVQDLHKMYFATLSDVQFDDIEPYIALF